MTERFDEEKLDEIVERQPEEAVDVAANDPSHEQRIIPDEPEFQVSKQRQVRSAAGETYFTFTLGSTDMPTLKRCCGSWPFSNTIFTGIRCTTLT